MEPALFAEFCEELTHEMNRFWIEAGASIAAARAEVAKIDRDLYMMLQLGAGISADRINTKMLALEVLKRERESFLATATEPRALLHSEMAAFYRTRVEELHAALVADTKERMAAVKALRSLIDEIILTPEGRELEIDVRGDRAGILRIATMQSPAAFAAGLSQVELVAGPATSDSGVCRLRFS